MKTKILTTLATITAITSAHAATLALGGITVVEADEYDTTTGTAGNTVWSGGAPTGGTTTRTQGSFGDEVTWKYRSSTDTDTGSWGGVPDELSGVYSSFGNGVSDNNDLTLTTTVTGLASDTYDVYAVFLSRNDTIIDGGIAAAISGNALVDYADTTGASGPAASFSLGVVGGEESVWEAFAVKIDTITGTGFSINAGVLGSTDTGSGIQRNTYIGVGYVAVPEPSSTALLGLGGLAFILRRRN